MERGAASPAVANPVVAAAAVVAAAVVSASAAEVPALSDSVAEEEAGMAYGTKVARKRMTPAVAVAEAES